MQHYTIPASAMDAQDSVPTLASPFRTPDGKRKKIPRPPNAFMLFRSWLIHDGKLPPEIGSRQQHISKIAGKAWKLLDEPSKNEWRKEALRRLQDHEKDYPNYKFEPSPKNCRTGLEKIRTAVAGSDDDTVRQLKALTDAYAKDHQIAASRCPRRERASPYKLPTTERAPQRPVRGYRAPQLIAGSQLGSPSMSLITFDSPSPSSVQSLSSLPLRAQQHAFAQGMAQQPLPYMFLPPGFPSHFEQAYQREDGVRFFAIPRSICSKLTESSQTIVFADNYAPINPFSPPPGYYAFDNTGIVPPVVNTSEMMAGTASDIAAAMLNLCELNHPYAHFNPNLGTGGNSFPVHQLPAQIPPVLPTSDVLPIPPSTSSLTPHEQEVFDTILGNSQLPFTLEDLLPLPLPLPEDGFMSVADSLLGPPSPATPSSPFPLSTSTAPEELSFTGVQINETERPMLQSPATNQCA